MIINTNTWHYRWYAFWLRHQRVSSIHQETLCHYFWMVVLGAPLTWVAQSLRGIRGWGSDNSSWIDKVVAGLGIVWILSGLGFLGYIFYAYSFIALMVVSGIAGFLILVVAIAVLSVRFESITNAVFDTALLVGEYAKAKKHRICPFIEFEEQKEKE